MHIQSNNIQKEITINAWSNMDESYKHNEEQETKH